MTSVAIVGGGVIGAAVAWRCAAAGLEVTVCDPDPSRSAARAAAGMLASASEARHGEEQLHALAQASALRWPAFAADLGAETAMDPGYVQSGTLAVARDADDLAALRHEWAYLDELGEEVTWLGGRALRTLEPALGPSVSGGYHLPGDHQVSPPRLLAALDAANQARGVRIDPNVPASPADLDALPADVVVVAAGWRSGELVVDLPVRPVKGQTVWLAPTATAVLPTHVLRGTEVYVAPRADEVVVGATCEEVGPDLTVRAGAVRDLLHAAWELIPGVAEASLVRCAVGLRPGTPDNAPIIGWMDDRVLVATGHYRNGVLLAPITADAVAALATGGAPPPEVAPLGPGRFTSG